ncbi:MAG: hypothetical protein IT371_19065 [Deltaproteobacteria bacterium]|nr:hypothetical protein [Deltaproteobacteria bacterium]
MHSLAKIVALGATVGLGAGSASAAEATYEGASRGAYRILNLPRMLRPFVASCEHETTHFRRLFCTALNDRLKAQRQAKVYAYGVAPGPAGPLVVKFQPGDPPRMEVSIRGCLTCAQPLADREGGDLAKARFFLFKLPKDILVKKGAGAAYDFGDITMATQTVELPKGTTEARFKQEILPHLRLDLLFRPEAGVTKVGKRFKYGVLTFELVGWRLFHKCAGQVYAASPKATRSYRVDRTDMTCEQNQPKRVVKRVKLPGRLQQAQVKPIMDTVSEDLHTCFDQFGVTGELPTEVVVTPAGQVKSVKVSGALATSPAAKCLERLVRAAPFPKFSGPDARLQWPFALRN